MVDVALDGAALTRRVPTFEYHDDFTTLFLDPVLQLHQLNLQRQLLTVVGFYVNPL